MDTINRNNLIKALYTLTQHIDQQYEVLNQLDGKVGDGDIGITMKTGLNAALKSSATWEEDLGLAFMGFARSFVENRASSYGTILATGLMAAAAYSKGRTTLSISDIPKILDAALEKMALRGKSTLGQKTVLDAVYAAQVAAAYYEGESLTELGILIRQKVEESVEAYSTKPNLQGRARMFGEKSVGITDPGMQVFLELVIALTNESA